MGEDITYITNSTAPVPRKGGTKLWTHPDAEATQMTAFMRAVNRKYGLKLKSYEELYEWSIGDIGAFWGEVWDFTGVRAGEGV